MLNTSALNKHFGFDMTPKFITETLKVSEDARDKRAFLWHEDKIPVIARALINHIADKGLAAPAAKDDENSDLF